MPIGCDDVDARMLEFLYGELPEGERAAIQAHLGGEARGCERCRRELADLRDARAQARQVLDEAPPARAHAAILRAAEAAAAARARVVPPVARESWWERLRSRWTFPTLATIGAVAVFLLANKIFLEPQKTYQRGRQGLVPAAAPVPAQAPTAEAPAPNEPAPAAAPEAEGSAKPSAGPANGGLSPRGGLDADESTKGGSGSDDRPMRAVLPSHRRMNPSRSQDQPARRESAEKEESAAVHPAMRAERPAKIAVDDGALDRSFAPPPPPRIAQPAPATPSAPAKKSVSASDDLEELMDDRGRGGGAPTSPAATGARAKAASAHGRTADESASTAAPPTGAPKAKRREEEEADEQPLEATTDEVAAAHGQERQDGRAVTRADRLFAAGRWLEAANAYRELLRRDPRNADAPRWRKRLAAAQAAVDR